MHKGVLAVAMIAVCSSLTGCMNTVSWSIEGNCSAKASCSVSGKIGGTFGGPGEKQSLPIYEKLLAVAASDIPDASLFEIDVTGSTISYPTNGLVTLTLVDTNTSVVTAAKQFSWYRSGNILRLSDPNAVNSWATSNGGTANELRYTLERMTTSAAVGPNTISVKSKYQGVQTASATSQFTVCSRYPSPYMCAAN